MRREEEETKELSRLIEFAMSKPTISFPARELRSYMESIFSMGSPPAIFHACEWVAAETFAAYFRQVKFDDDAKLRCIADFFSAKEWGMLEFSKVNMEKAECSVRVVGCFECEQERSPIKDCYMIRGLLTGAFSALFHRKIITTETRCRYRNDDCCEFVAHPLTEGS